MNETLKLATLMKIMGRDNQFDLERLQIASSEYIAAKEDRARFISAVKANISELNDIFVANGMEAPFSLKKFESLQNVVNEKRDGIQKLEAKKAKIRESYKDLEKTTMYDSLHNYGSASNSVDWWVGAEKRAIDRKIADLDKEIAEAMDVYQKLCDELTSAESYEYFEELVNGQKSTIRDLIVKIEKDKNVGLAYRINTGLMAVEYSLNYAKNQHEIVVGSEKEFVRAAHALGIDIAYDEGRTTSMIQGLYTESILDDMNQTKEDSDLKTEAQSDSNDLEQDVEPKITVEPKQEDTPKKGATPMLKTVDKRRVLSQDEICELLAGEMPGINLDAENREKTDDLQPNAGATPNAGDDSEDREESEDLTKADNLQPNVGATPNAGDDSEDREESDDLTETDDLQPGRANDKAADNRKASLKMPFSQRLRVLEVKAAKMNPYVKSCLTFGAIGGVVCATGPLALVAAGVGIGSTFGVIANKLYKVARYNLSSLEQIHNDSFFKKDEFFVTDILDKLHVTDTISQAKHKFLDAYRKRKESRKAGMTNQPMAPVQPIEESLEDEPLFMGQDAPAQQTGMPVVEDPFAFDDVPDPFALNEDASGLGL